MGKQPWLAFFNQLQYVLPILAISYILIAEAKFQQV